MWSDALTPIRWCYRGLSLLLVIAVVLLPVVVLQGRLGQARVAGGRSLAERSLMTWSQLVCRVFGLKPDVRGELSPGPVLVVSNHISWMDIQLLHSAGAMSFVGKAEIASWPVLGFLAARGGTIFHRRGSHDSSAGAAGSMLARLKSGGRVAIFPEGGILPGEAISRFHARLFKVAVEADCPVQPAMLRYLRDGRRDPDVRFMRGESFVVNAIRLLGRPACRAQLRFLPAFVTDDRPRRALALAAESVVKQAYDGPVNDPGAQVD